MSMDAITRIETVRGHKLSEQEVARLREVAETLHLRGDDAVWDIVAAMEYQRVFYEALPGKIAGASTEIIQGVALAAEKEVAAAQAHLADSVVEQAKRLSTNIQYATLLPMIMAALVCLLAYGSLLLWAGFQIGSGQAQPLILWLQMPSGLLMGGLCLAMGLFCGFGAARSFAGAEKGWYRGALVTTTFLLAGAVSFCLGL